MSSGSKKWIIRDGAGRIEGPFTTEKVLYKIGRGEFSGEEFISLYPGGKWLSISQDSQFYDKLLEVLSAHPQGEVADTTYVMEFTRPQAETQVTSTDAKEEVTAVDDLLEDEWVQGRTRIEEPRAEEPRVEEPEPSRTQTGTGRAGKKSKRKSKKKHADIELVDTRPEYWRRLLIRARLPAAALLVGGLVFVLLFWDDSSEEQRIHLLVPQKGLAQVSPQSLVARRTQGIAAFMKDSFPDYIRAQNDFVHIVERSSKDSTSMAFLCMTYLQLWPYAYQDSQDNRAFATLVQMSSAANPGGMDSATCRVADLIVRARFQEAMSMVDAILDSQSSGATLLIFYFFKGLLYSGGPELAASIGYLQSSQQMAARWILPFSIEAQAQAKLEKYGEAANLYRRILQLNPDHMVARIELGLLEYKHFGHSSQAEQYLHQGLSEGHAPRPTLSRGYLGLAELALKRGDQRDALKYAQKAFLFNSSNASAKNLISQLGGVRTRVKSNDLVFEGDQFYREGDYHTAQGHYKAAFDDDPKNAIAAMKAARCLWKLSLSTEAIEWLNRAIRADASLIEAYVLMAEYQAARYNFQAAGRVLESARRANPKSYEVFRGFAAVELKRGNANGALMYGKQALQLYENDVETQILMAQISLALRDYKMAFNYASKAVEIDLNHRGAQIVFAQTLAGLQGIETGLDHMMKLVGSYPQVIEYRLALGKMLLKDERYHQAEEIFRQIIKLDDKPKEAYIELAKAVWADSNSMEALNLLLKAAVLDPADAEPLYISGGIYMDLKRPAEAKVQFTRVLGINKLYPLVHYQLGRAALMLNDPKEALLETELEKRANPSLADAYLLAAEAHTLLQQYGSCAAEYQKAIKLRPQQATIYIRLAQCYRKKGDLEAASAMLNVAAKQESGLADIYKEQGAIYEMRGDVVHAIESYQQYFVLNPDAPDRQQIEDRISALQRGQRP